MPTAICAEAEDAMNASPVAMQTTRRTTRMNVNLCIANPPFEELFINSVER
jgi:hypothetical protein